MPFLVIRQDITKITCDAIVNAANHALSGGGGVDGAIHRAAGPGLLAECRTLGGCETGEAKATGAHDLRRVKYIIHTVGPVWEGGSAGEEAQLRACYRNSLEKAQELGCESAAFPLISAGAYGYPTELAAKIAGEEIRAFLLDHDMTVYLCFYERAALLIGRELYGEISEYILDEYIDPDREFEMRRRRELFARNRACEPLWGEDVTSPGPKGICRTAAPAVSEGGFPTLEERLKYRDESFQEMLFRKIDEKHLTDAACYKRANIDRRLFSKIRSDAEYRPHKTTVLAFAVALELPLAETNEMLLKAGFALSDSSRFDIIVKWFIERGEYDIYTINNALFTFDQSLLGGS